jgi:uncharacterized protein (TIGR03437 family)
VILLWLAGATGFAQSREPMPPAIFRKGPNASQRALAPGKRERLDRPLAHELGPLSESELLRLKSRAGLRAVGIHRSLAGIGIQHNRGPRANGMVVDGAWSPRDDGSRVWRYAIDSEDAVGIRIHFTDFAAGAGRVWVYASDTGDSRAESFTGSGPAGNGDFWSQTVFGSEAIIEFEPDPANLPEETTPFQIKEIAHLWRSPDAIAATTPAFVATARSARLRSVRDFFEQLSAAGSDRSAAASTATPSYSLIGAEAAPCQLDVVCYPDWEQTSRAVALILFESEGSTYACSGTLLNTRDQSFTPYFLTAAHCITSDADARTVEAFWFFRNTTCNGQPPVSSTLVSTLGARQITRLGDFDDPRGDFNLLLLADVPDGVVFAGWDPNAVAYGTPAVGLHHPAGEQERITFGTVVRDDYYGVSGSYVIVQEDLGRTEPGSSGSGLFSAPNVLTGVLSFGLELRRGQTVCDLQPAYVGYSRFSELYPEVSGYLEGSLPPPPDHNTPLVSGVPREFSLEAVRRPTLFQEPEFRVEVPENAISLTITLDGVSPETADVDMYVRHETAPVVSAGGVVADFESTGPTSIERVVVNRTTAPSLQPGTYYIRFALITRLAGVSGRVTSTIELPAGLSQNAPSVQAVLHAASQRVSAIAPGQIVSIYGTNLGPESGVQPGLDGTGRIPTSVNGVSVTFNGVPAPILFARADQTNVQAPYEIAGLDSASIVVSYNTLASQPFAAAVSASAPQIFTLSGSSNRAIAFSQDKSPITTDNPAVRGQIIYFYVTGEGVVSPALPAGVLASIQTTLPTPVLPVSVRIGGAAANVLFAGIPPGLAGVMQVNVIVPSDAITGSNVFLSVRVGDTESNMVTIAVQ